MTDTRQLCTDVISG